MRLAVIDLGTNSIRFDVHEISSNRKGLIQHRRLYREKTMVRLGQDLFLAGKLSNEGKRRTLEAVRSYKVTMDALHVDKIVAFGTAAVRDALDGEAFLKEMEEKTGVHFRMITGAEEASLIAKGVLNFEKTPSGIYALMDIGGGSTEISICKGKKILHSHSFNLGVAKLQQVFLKTQPPKKAQGKGKKKSDPVQDLRNFIKSVVLPKMLIDHWPKAQKIIGSSGSVIALAKLVHGSKDAAAKPFDRKNLSKTVKQIEDKTPIELLSMKGMEPKRVDLILAGGILLDEIASLLGAKQIRTSEYALRDGILVDELEHYHKTTKTVSFPLDEVEKRIATWGIDHDHANTVRVHAEWMFDELQSVHQLKPKWKNYLSAAAILHDVGEMISHSNHAEHSEYIIKNAHFVGMHEWETNLIALLCRYHKEEKMAEKMNKIPYDKKDELRAVFLKLLSILQMADAIDRTHKHSLQLKKKKNFRREIELSFKSKHPCDLEILRFEQKKTLFELIFKREIWIRRIK